jgi:hypothetical protein
MVIALRLQLIAQAWAIDTSGDIRDATYFCRKGPERSVPANRLGP